VMSARSTKTDALIRDIAKLIVTYSPSVWRPVLDDLAEAGEAYRRVGTNVAELIDEAARTPTKQKVARAKATAPSGPKKKKAAAAEGTSRAAQMSLEFSPDRQRTLGALADALTERRLLPTAAEIRRVYLESGGKGDLPKVRRAAIHHLLRHLDGIPQKSFDAIHELVKPHESSRDTADDYQRWFELIRKP
jgi:hypothetical protein